MSENNNSVSRGGVGFVGLLTIAFVVLKLTNVIDWKWLWVLSPIWITAAIVAVIILAVFATAWISSVLDIRRRRKMREKAKKDGWL